MIHNGTPNSDQLFEFVKSHSRVEIESVDDAVPVLDQFDEVLV